MKKYFLLIFLATCVLFPIAAAILFELEIRHLKALVGGQSDNTAVVPAFSKAMLNYNVLHFIIGTVLSVFAIWASTTFYRNPPNKYRGLILFGMGYVFWGLSLVIVVAGYVAVWLYSLAN